MHDIDRAMFEMEQPELGGNEIFEAYETYESPFTTSGGTQEMELVAELLEVASEAELDRFLGDLISRAGSAIGGFARSDAGRALGGILKSAARQALPTVGRLVGDTIAPGVGGQFGAKAGSWLGNKLELEGLSAEDREFETARTFVRFAQDAAQTAAETAATGPAAAVAQRAAVAAAQRHLPQLAPALAGARPGGGAGASATAAGMTGSRTGRWVRHGNRVVIYGL